MSEEYLKKAFCSKCRKWSDSAFDMGEIMPIAKGYFVCASCYSEYVGRKNFPENYFDKKPIPSES